MVALSEVVAANECISSTLPSGLVAVFVGGTSGVGEYTVKAFARHALEPQVYIVGRSQDAANRILAECKKLSPGGQFEFIKADVSSVKVIDDVCRQITDKQATINILFQSQGSMAWGAKTPEGLHFGAALVFHSRLRFILNLLPLLQNATSLRRVVSVMAATCEGAIDVNNIPGDGMGLLERRSHLASIQTLLLEEAARQAPDVSFVHTVPGIVKSGIGRDSEGFRNALAFAISNLLGPLVQTPPSECGELHTFVATSARYPPRQNGAVVAGVPLNGKVAEARGTNGRTGSGVYSVSNKGESAPPKAEKWLAQYREDETAKKVWGSVAADFKRITGTEVAPYVR